MSVSLGPVAAPIPIAFVGGTTGEWAIDYAHTIRGDPIDSAARLSVITGRVSTEGGVWTLRGVTSNLRYTTAAERADLNARTPALGRPEATCAALIPIRKAARWWDLAQDERRAILAAESQHVAIGLEYMPAVARQLIHCRDLGEPWDFLTWFEFAAADAGAFEQLVARLRGSEEWRDVERETDIRLTRAPG